MGKKNSKLDFSGQNIYVGIDTGKKSWRVTILTKDLEHKTFTQPPEPEALVCAEARKDQSHSRQTEVQQKRRRRRDRGSGLYG